MAELNEVLTSQGTRKSDIPPWMSYAASFEEKLDPKLEEEIKKYSEQVHSKSSAQNEEELCRQKEINNEIAKEYRWVTPEEYEDEEIRVGRIIHSDEFIRKLRNECHLRCWYKQHPHPQKLVLWLSNRDGTEAPVRGCWVQAGYMPEYSIMRFDEHGVPLDEKYRGWRTCLLQLIMKTAISERLVNKVFGEARGPASARYLSTLHQLRSM